MNKQEILAAAVAELRTFALELGVGHVESGPLVRSSYHADGQAAMIRAMRARQGRPAA